MSPAKKKLGEPNYHHGDLRRAILEGALELISESGMQNLSLREVARKIGVTTAAPYHHFKDREALLIQIAVQGFGQLLQRLNAAKDAAETAEEELKAECRAYLKFAQEQEALYSVMFSREVALKPEYPELRESSDPCFGLLCASVTRVSKLGEQKSAEASLCVWSMLHGLTTLNQNNFLEEDDSEQERIAVDGVLGVVRGLSIATRQGKGKS